MKFEFENVERFPEEKTTNYAVEVLSDNALKVTRDGIEKIIFIENDYEYVYRGLKTKIKAKGAAQGFYNYIVDTIEKDFATCLIYRILNHAIDTMRPYNFI